MNINGEEFQKDAGENRMIWSELYYTCVPMLQIMYVEWQSLLMADIYASKGGKNDRLDKNKKSCNC